MICADPVPDPARPVPAVQSLKGSEEQLLQRLYPEAELLWFGSSQDVGFGNASEQGLIAKIKAGRVDMGKGI